MRHPQEYVFSPSTGLEWLTDEPQGPPLPLDSMLTAPLPECPCGFWVPNSVPQAHNQFLLSTKNSRTEIHYNVFPIMHTKLFS